MKIVINRCFGGFGLSEAAYLKLHEYGVPIQAYVEQERDQETGLYLDQPANDGEVIFDRTLTNGKFDEPLTRLVGRYWDCWTSENRAHPLLIRLVEELGSEVASGRCAKLSVVEIPDDVEFTIEEYDGLEHVAEVHREWR